MKHTDLEASAIIVVIQYMESKQDNEPIDLVFRAHLSKTKIPKFCAQEHYPFDCEFRSLISLHAFSKEVEHHLGKTEYPVETFLISTSPVLQWTIHTVGQRHRKIRDPVFAVGLAIFDIHRWRKCKDTKTYVITSPRKVVLLKTKSGSNMRPTAMNMWPLEKSQVTV